MNRAEYFKQFKEGKIEIYLVVRKDYDNVLQKSNIFFRKLFDEKITVTGWIDKKDAEDYLRSNITDSSNWKIERISSKTFKKFLDSLDNEFRKKFYLDLV